MESRFNENDEYSENFKSVTDELYKFMNQKNSIENLQKIYYYNKNYFSDYMTRGQINFDSINDSTLKINLSEKYQILNNIIQIDKITSIINQNNGFISFETIEKMTNYRNK
jgi:hypothetical protein